LGYAPQGGQLARALLLGLLESGHESSQWRWQHEKEIRDRYGYQGFNDPFLQFRLNRWLYARCWTGIDRPSVLFDRSIAWLLANKVLLPGLTVLERAVARVRSRAPTNGCGND
jgi:hypothetical protein